jgi:parallel beta-helix repeat protein
VTNITANTFTGNLGIISNGIYLLGSKDTVVKDNKFEENGILTSES